MKKILFALFVLAGTLMINSCNEKIDLSGNFKETAVVYGLLDQFESVHMIKVNRAFIGPGDALQFATIPDSNYFENVVATVEEWLSGSIQRTWTLGDTTIINKDPNGIFYAPTQDLKFFKTDASNPLNPNAIYRLKLDINNGEFQVTAETGIVDGLTMNVSSTNAPFKFVENPGEYKPGAIQVGTGNSYQVNTTIEMHYNERIGSSYTPKSFSWNVGEVEVNPGESKQFALNGQTFYDLVNQSCSTSDPLVDRRLFDRLTITVTGAAEEFYNYILVNQPSSALAQSKPTYTNLTATGDHPVVGIFSSRQTIQVEKPFFVSASQAYIRAIDKKSTQELCTGPITGTLLFCSDHPGDNILGSEEFYSCN
ncbi:MAG: hypothetical protein MK066_04460 [Crocinitomicaceae bacterium]|nr:hypothetical protein [Crocinitomicaceae bacterium]